MTDEMDRIISDSKSLRDDLLKTIGKLQAFTDALSAQAERLQHEVDDNAGDHSTGNHDSGESR
jgi:hypothetical protein